MSLLIRSWQEPRDIIGSIVNIDTPVPAEMIYYDEQGNPSYQDDNISGEFEIDHYDHLDYIYYLNPVNYFRGEQMISSNPSYTVDKSVIDKVLMNQRMQEAYNPYEEKQ